jgi:uncharacterized protein (TIGR02678 family)
MIAAAASASIPRSAPTIRRPGAILRLEVDDALQHERRRALRGLLLTPLVTPDGPEAALFALVRRHAPFLEEWFAHHAGWSLAVRPDLVRLHKTPADLGDGTRPASDPLSGQPFDRRRYVLLCLALAALERSERQTTLGRLAEQIAGLAAGDPQLAANDVAFTLESANDRRALVHVLRWLLGLGALRRVQGDEERFLRDRSDVLYGIVRPVIAQLLAARRSPSLVAASDFPARLAAVAAEPPATTPEARNRQIKVALGRRLLDDPVIYLAQLSDDERAYLERQRGHLLPDLQRATGLEPEVRAEGLLLADLEGDATDIGLPEEGTDGHLTLLLATHLAERLRADAAFVTTADELVRRTRTLIREHQSHWRKEVTQPGADRVLTTRVVTRLAGLGLVRLDPVGDTVQPLAALGRFALSAPVIRPAHV